MLGLRRKAMNMVRPVGLRRLPAFLVGGLARRREFPVILLTSASAIKKKIPENKRRVVPDRFIINNFDWQGVSEAVREENLHPTIREIFLDGRHYTDTSQWIEMIKAVDEFERGKIQYPARHGAYWCRSRADVARYFEILLECHRSIKSDGYKTQEQLLKQSGMISEGGVVRNVRDEIEVLIDASGDLVFSGARGNHRFSIVQILDVRPLPVVLGGVDKAFVKKITKRKNISVSAIFYECVRCHEALEFFRINEDQTC